MPITKSAIKALRQNKTKRVRNIKWQKAFRGIIKEIRDLSLDNKKAEAGKLLPQAYKLIDKATKRGLLKQNTAARRKSKVARLINQQTIQTKAKPSPQKSELSDK